MPDKLPNLVLNLIAMLTSNFYERWTGKRKDEADPIEKKLLAQGWTFSIDPSNKFFNITFTYVGVQTIGTEETSQVSSGSAAPVVESGTLVPGSDTQSNGGYGESATTDGKVF